MSKVLCIGSAGKDIFLPTKEGVIIDTPDDLLSQQKLSFELGGKHYIDDRYEALGGCASNVAVGLTRLGVNTCVYAHVGDDHDGDWIVQTLVHEGVNCQYITRERDHRSDLSAIIVDQNSAERTIFVSRDVGECLVVNENTIKTDDAQWFFVGSLYGECGVHTKTILSALEETTVKLAYNPGQRNIKEHVDIVRKMLRRADIVFLNKDEATEIVAEHESGYNETTLDDEILLLKALQALSDAIIVLTHGGHGAWIAHKKEIYHVQASSDTDMVDTTGAGDAFSSGFFAAVVHGHDMAQAGAWGYANAQHVVRHYGAQEGLLHSEGMNEHDGIKFVRKIQ